MALQNAGHITSGLWGTPMTGHSLQADVFAYGIILCETIARVPADPDYLPRTEVTLGWEQGAVRGSSGTTSSNEGGRSVLGMCRTGAPSLGRGAVSHAAWGGMVSAGGLRAHSEPGKGIRAGGFRQRAEAISVSWHTPNLAQFGVTSGSSPAGVTSRSTALCDSAGGRGPGHVGSPGPCGAPGDPTLFFPWCRILVWTSPLSAPWWELTARRPSSSWLFTAAV